MGEHAKLYDDDFLAWTEVQAAEMRKLAKRPELSNLMDWNNLIEEVETLGRSDVRAAEGNLVQCIAHLIKMTSVPDERLFGKWSAEARVLNSNFQTLYAPSMRQRIDLDRVWQAAMAAAEAGLWPEGLRPSRALPAKCPFDLADFLESFSAAACLEKLSAVQKNKSRSKTH
jgi:Domain of unknown function DUF29